MRSNPRKRAGGWRYWAVLFVAIASTCPLILRADETPPKADAALTPHPSMLRYPDVSRDRIVFLYANDLWLVPREGGTALPLSGPAGQELHPKFSADGKTIAFVANYDGNLDLYTIPIEGGAPTRVTHHPAGEALCDWANEGRLLFSTNGLSNLQRQTELYEVEAKGGLPRKLPVPYGANGAISADGRTLAYTAHSTDTRTWKRYRGGMATDIWLFDLKDHTSKRITEWEGTDTLPMWHGKTVYYLSDAGESHRLNLWSYDTESGARQEITKFKDYDVRWPSMGPGTKDQGEIVFQNGSTLYLLELDAREPRAVSVTIPGDRPKIRRRSIDTSKDIMASGISPSGKRAVFEARGDIWTVPAEHGSPRNLTRTDGVADRDPSWSPDGRWIAYFCDASGEYELCIVQSDGSQPSKRLTQDGAVFRYDPTWSPNSKHLVFSDKSGAIYLHTIDGETKKIDTHPTAEQPRIRWSHDSAWLAYTKDGDRRRSSIWLYDVAGGKAHQVTGGRFNDSWPVFDRKGDYLFFASNRRFTSPMYEDVGTTFVYANTDLLLAVPLRAEVGVPKPPKSDEEKWSKPGEANKDQKKDKDAKQDGKDDGQEKKSADEKPKDDKQKDDKAKPDEKKADAAPLKIELDGFERRAIVLPVKPGNFTGLEVSEDGKLLYVNRPPRGGGGEDASIKILDIKADEKQEQTVLDKAAGFTVSADGKKLLVRRGENYAIVDAKADQKFDKTLATKGLQSTIDPRAEWRQMLREAWRLQRDYFYDPTMHGVDWPQVYERYKVVLEDCTSREDVQFVIGEMISELNVGHTYARTGGDMEKPDSVSVGLLGADYELHDGAYRIVTIHEGGPWDVDARGPLSQPGVDVKQGDYLLSVNGLPLDAEKDPWAAFQNLAGKTVTIQVSAAAQDRRSRPGGDRRAVGQRERSALPRLDRAEPGPCRGKDWRTRGLCACSRHGRKRPKRIVSPVLRPDEPRRSDRRRALERRRPDPDPFYRIAEPAGNQLLGSSRRRRHDLAARRPARTEVHAHQRPGRLGGRRVSGLFPPGRLGQADRHPHLGRPGRYVGQSNSDRRRTSDRAHLRFL